MNYLSQLSTLLLAISKETNHYLFSSRTHATVSSPASANQHAVRLTQHLALSSHETGIIPIVWMDFVWLLARASEKCWLNTSTATNPVAYTTGINYYGIVSMSADPMQVVIEALYQVHVFN